MKTIKYLIKNTQVNMNVAKGEPRLQSYLLKTIKYSQKELEKIGVYDLKQFVKDVIAGEDWKGVVWMQRFLELKIHNHNINKLEDKKIKSILEWRLRQNKNYRLNLLQNYQVALLKTLSDIRILKSLDEIWKSSYDELLNYLKKKKKYPPDRSRLNLFYLRARMNYKRGKLSEERVKLMEQLPGWTWGILRKEEWLNSYYKVSKILKNNSNDYSLKNSEEDKWLQIQIKYYRQGNLSNHRISLLKNLPNWASCIKKSRHTTWLQNYSILKPYLKMHKKYPPNTRGTSLTKIGRWIERQRYLYLHSKLVTSRIKLLEKLPNWKWRDR